MSVKQFRVEPVFNPLDKRHLGESVVDALLRCEPHPLPPHEPFIAAGVYAIYYIGDFKLYEPISILNRDNKFERPIYVGKAVPKGARKGGFGLDINPGLVLYKRLEEHAETIRQTKNLKIEDFYCRYLAVDDIWIPLGESLLIDSFAPVWNKIVDGFGIHDPGSGRQKQKMSMWDVLHPGRAFAQKRPPHSKTIQDIESAVQIFLKKLDDN